MKKAGATGFDAYAHHPYYGAPSETPATPSPGRGGVTLGNIDALVAEVTRLYGRKRIWLTEYGYQTNPPDRWLGVSPQLQARYLADAAYRAYSKPYVDMLIQYLYKDEPQLSRFQTGLIFTDDRWKPSLQAFRLPFAQMGRSGERVTVWGQIRDGKSGRKRYRLEVLRKNAWKPVGRARLTNEQGVFVRTIRVKRGALFRIWAPNQRRFSQQLRIR
jgi:hypothetical protein